MEKKRKFIIGKDQDVKPEIVRGKKAVEFNSTGALKVASRIEKDCEEQLEMAHALRSLAESKTVIMQLDATNKAIIREIDKNKDILAKVHKEVNGIHGSVEAEKEKATHEIDIIKKELSSKTREVRKKINDKESECAAELVAVVNEVAGKIKVAKKSEKDANERALDATTKAQKAEKDYKKVVDKITGGLVNV